jgi:hypothetical protein
MTRPIPDKAEVALEYPDKSYVGTFERTSRFGAQCDASGVAITLERSGDAAANRVVRMHFHHALFAEILREMARTASAVPLNDSCRAALCGGAKALCHALEATPAPKDARAACDDELARLTPGEEEVLLLHILE